MTFVVKTFTRLIAFGDSITNGIALCNPGIVNFGFNATGIFVGRNVELFQKITLMRPGDLVLTSIGTNDADVLMRHDKLLSYYIAPFRNWITAIRRQGAEMILLGVSSENYKFRPPEWSGYINTPLNDALIALAQEMKVPFSPTGNRGNERDPDGVHYTRRGYQQLFVNALADAGIRPMTAPLANT